MDDADFYLGSQELTGWSQPRAVSIVGDAPGGLRVELDPPAGDGTRKFILRPRYAGDVISETAPPVVVNVFAMDGSHVGLGELYRTRAEAVASNGSLSS